MTQKALRFVEANKESPVVYGSVIGGDKGPGSVEGVTYRLEDGRVFRLSVKDAKALPDTPRWRV